MPVGSCQFNLDIADGETSADYRRRARRLRHLHREDPGKLQQSLRRLSDEIDRDRPLDRTTGRAASPAADFAGEVGAALDGPVLRYSSRLRLLKRATELGIGRFEANLVIATVQHRARAARHSSQPSGRQVTSSIPAPWVREEADGGEDHPSGASRGVAPVIAAALAIELLAAVAGWWLLFR